MTKGQRTLGHGDSREHPECDDGKGPEWGRRCKIKLTTIKKQEFQLDLMEEQTGPGSARKLEVFAVWEVMPKHVADAS